MDRGEKRQARLSLLLFLVIFALGYGKAYLTRPQCPDLSRINAPWPPEGCLLDASILGKALVPFPPGTTLSVALSSLELKVGRLGSRSVLPRAGVLVQAGKGWSVRSMTQKERWIWRIPMDIHSCTPDDLSRIRGIGPSLGEKIHRFVRDKKSLSSYEDLLAVPGVGPSRLEILKGFLSLK